MRTSDLVLLVVMASRIFCACSDEGGGGEEGIVIGGIFASDVDDILKRELDGVLLAVEEINQSGAGLPELQVINLSPSSGEVVSPENAAEGVRLLFDQEKAVGFVSGHGLDTVYRMIEVTNSPDYSDLVQCNGSASDPGANIPGMMGADTNDTFYRTVVSYEFHIELGARVFLEREWFNIGLFRLDDTSGQEVSLGVQLKIGEYSDQGARLVFDKTVPRESFDLEQNRAQLDEVIEMSQMGEVDVVILATLQAQSIPIVDYFTQHGYQGVLFLTVASTNVEMFDTCLGLESWLDAGHVMIAIEPDNYGGQNSDAFVQAFRDRFAEEPAAHSATAYDCTYALALALLYADMPAPTAAEVKDHLPNFKEDNRLADEIDVGIGPAGFLQAAQAVAGGGRVNFLGASGRLLFDENGDRPRQGMVIISPNAAERSWEVVERYDAELNLVEP
jgi:ABC-type branched-subunit amino acid transport system substrate-binding protein